MTNEKPHSTAKADVTQMRRERITALLARGLTQREITMALGKPLSEGGLLNPDTGKPYDLATVNRDIKAIRREWQARTAKSIDKHQARQLMELQELKRFAWANKDADLALRALEKEMRLLGTAKQTDGIQVNIQIELLSRFEQIVLQLGLDPQEALEAYIQGLQEQYEAQQQPQLVDST